MLLRDANEKAASALLLDMKGAIDCEDHLDEPPGIPGRPARPVLVAHTELKARSMKTVEGRAALIHALAHIELNAIDLALDLVWRFPDMPDEFYRQWLNVAQEEARHFTLLRNHLVTLGYEDRKSVV